jgi:hypothetical protein
MYAWIWTKLPGTTATKTLTAITSILAILALLFLVIFPWLTIAVGIDQVTV